MRRLSAALCCLAALALIAWTPKPKPKVTTVGLVVRVAPDSSLTLTATTYLSGSLAKPDSVRWTLYRTTSANDSLVASRKSKELTQVFAVPAPAYGASVRYILYARVYRDQTASGAFKGDTVDYTRPEAPLPPPPVVDSVTAVSLIVVDGNLTYTHAGFFNQATRPVASCQLGGETLDALGRMVTGCRLATGGAAYSTVNCVVVARASGVRWAYPSNTVSDCQTKAAPHAATMYGARWQPAAVPLDSIAFTLDQVTHDTVAHQYRTQVIASLR